MSSRNEIRRVHVLAPVLFFFVGCNNAPNQVSPRETKNDPVADKTSAEQQPATNPPRPAAQFIPNYEDAANYYELAKKTREANALSADVDLLLKRVENSPFVLVESFEELHAYPTYGYYYFVLLYINSPGEVYACSKDRYRESAVLSREYPISAFDENLRHLAHADNACHNKEDSHKYAASHPSVIRFVWSERGEVHEYWVVGCDIFHRFQKPPTADCLKLLDRLLEVYKNCKAFF